jgi:signal transduction histidine kinase
MAPIENIAMSDMSLLEGPRKHGWIISAIVCLLLVSVAGAVYLIIDNRQSGSEIIRTQNVQAAAFRLLALIQQAESGQRGYILTGKDHYLEPFTRSVQRMPDALSDLAASTEDDPDLQQEVSALSEMTQKKLDELRTTIAAFQRGGPSASLPIVLTDEGQKAMEQIRVLAREILVGQRIKLALRTNRWRLNSDLLIGLGATTLLLTILSAAIIIRDQRRYAAVLDAARGRLMTINADLEERVASRTAALQEANEEIQRYAHIASHDLRAPLVNIMGYSSEIDLVRKDVLDILRESAALPEEASDRLTRLNEDFDEALSFIKQSIDKMNRLINALLTLARSGQREFRYEDLDMGVIFASIKANLHHQLSTKGANLDVGPMPHIGSDRLAIEQIFGNIAENAIKYLDPDRVGEVSITARSKESETTFTVADNGRGIAERDIGRIFDPFRRAGALTEPGEGIGLAHVKMLVRRLGGRITCESALGAGSRFIIVLPSKIDKRG